MPRAEMQRPPDKHRGATKPALRGPDRSSQPPQIAAAEPRNTKNKVNIQPRSATLQSQVVVNSAVINVESAEHATGLVMPIAWLHGSQNTLNPYAMPIHR